MERRRPIDSLIVEYSRLFKEQKDGAVQLSEMGFNSLMEYLEKDSSSMRPIAIQVGAKWAAAAQRISLRKFIASNGVQTWACLWAMRWLRSNLDVLFQEYESNDICFIQILLLKELDFDKAAPFLIERFLLSKEINKDIRSMANLALNVLLDKGVSPETVRALQLRYPRVESLGRWRPKIPGQAPRLKLSRSNGRIDFHQMVRSVQDMKSFASLTRTVYLISLFHTPLTQREWSSLLLTPTDYQYFEKMVHAGVLELSDHGLSMASSTVVRRTVNDFLYESYGLAKETARKNEAVKKKEDRERKVKSSGLDRQALNMVPDGIICLEKNGKLYYANPAAEKILNQDAFVRQGLFGSESIEQALSNYNPARVKDNIQRSMDGNGVSAEIFGDRVSISSQEKQYDITLGQKVLLIRDNTDQRLVDEEIGKLYRHELNAALDVLGAGVSLAIDMIKEGQVEESQKCLEQVEQKRLDLANILRERFDFIRLHSESFKIKPFTFILNDLIDRVIDRNMEMAASKSVKLVSDHMELETVYVSGEERFLQTAIDNVIRNAIKFSPENSQVRVQLEIKKNWVFIHIEDSGPGIPRENLGKIFGLGFTTNGAGRGLYMAKRIMFAHGGTINVHSEPGKGCLFSVKLPHGLGDSNGGTDFRTNCG